MEEAKGKLMVYGSSLMSRGEPLRTVSEASEKVARLLKMSFEVKTFTKEAMPVYVYYKNGDEDPIPLYCSKGEDNDMQEVCTALRNMIFVLSFHPKHSALKQALKDIMPVS